MDGYGQKIWMGRRFQLSLCLILMPVFAKVAPMVILIITKNPPWSQVSTIRGDLSQAGFSFF